MKDRITFLQEKYGERKVAPHEQLSSEAKSKIKKQHYKHSVRKRTVQAILNDTNLNVSVQKEVHHIIDVIDNLKQLCPKCKEEQIIAVITLFVQRRYNNKLKEENTRIWKKHKLTWKIYGRIVSNMLNIYRSRLPLPRNTN